MFTPKDIVTLLRTRPFVPFFIQMSSGDQFDVLHPDQAIVSRGHVSLGLPPEAGENGGVFETTTLLSILHITEMRPIQRRQRRRRA